MDVPVPEEANVILPGLALAWAMNSETERAGEEFGTAMMFGVIPMSVTGAKSATGS